MSPEIVIGRVLAFCIHPVAAWRVLTPPGRALVIGAYFVVSYVAVLTALALLWNL
jgi:hypothetical protein